MCCVLLIGTACGIKTDPKRGDGRLIRGQSKTTQLTTGRKRKTVQGTAPSYVCNPFHWVLSKDWSNRKPPLFGIGWRPRTATLVSNHQWPRRATFFPPSMGSLPYGPYFTFSYHTGTLRLWAGSHPSLVFIYDRITLQK